LRKASTPFGEWTPDAGVLASTASDASGVYSMGGRYQPIKSLTPYHVNARTGDRCMGHIGAKSSTGQIVNFFGDQYALYRMINRVLVNVSRPGGYSADRDAAWKFDQYNNFVFAACRGAPVQVLELGGTGEFQDLGGGAGEADTCGRIGPHFLLAQGAELRISAFNNPTDYEPNPETQAQIAYLDQRGGIAHAILGGTDVGVILQERMISRMAYTGGASAFELTPIEFNRGCLGPLAVAQLGRMAFYASEEGIFLYDGQTSLPIGANKIDRYFASKLNYTYRNRVSCALDTERKCFCVAFPTGSSPSITEMLIYSVPDQRWTHDDVSAQMLFEMPREGVSIDDTAAIQTVAGTTDLDSITLSVDSPAWRETRKQWAAVADDRTVSIFDGPNRPAVLETGEAELLPGRHSFVTEIMPICDATPAAVTVNVVSKRHRFDEAPVVSTVANVNQYGAAPVRVHSRYLRARVNIAAAATWSEAHGVHTDARPTGAR
jgi:hypothetical protein